MAFELASLPAESPCHRRCKCMRMLRIFYLSLLSHEPITLPGSSESLLVVSIRSTIKTLNMLITETETISWFKLNPHLCVLFLPDNMWSFLISQKNKHGLSMLVLGNFAASAGRMMAKANTTFMDWLCQPLWTTETSRCKMQSAMANFSAVQKEVRHPNKTSPKEPNVNITPITCWDEANFNNP